MMKYKYQLIMLGSDVSIKKDLLELFYKKLVELGLSKEIIKIITPKNFHSEYHGNEPAFAFYFGDIEGQFQDIDITNILLKDGTMILPIYFTKGSFSKEIPKDLENQNGIEYQDFVKDRIVDTALEAFELLRYTRKVFISYKRDESTSIAIQLFEALEAQNFDVFLDTHSIGLGQPFKEDLWHRMTDSDVIILLNTPKFLESNWCKDELAEAEAKQIGIVQLIWPDHDIIRNDTYSHLSFPLNLQDTDFEEGVYKDASHSKLNKSALQRILVEVESVRARNLAARQDNLITEFRKIAQKYGKSVTVQPEKYLTETDGNHVHTIYIPTIGIPISTSCQSAEIKKNLLGYADVKIRLIYDDIRIRDKWLNHLDWLNDNIKADIKTLKKQNFEAWFQ